MSDDEAIRLMGEFLRRAITVEPEDSYHYGGLISVEKDCVLIDGTWPATADEMEAFRHIQREP